MTRLVTTESVELSPGEMRALGKLSALHPLSTAEVSEYRDPANVGWAIVVFRVNTNSASTRSRYTTYRYMVSPTGRVWRATDDNQRIEPPVFDADYADKRHA